MYKSFRSLKTDLPFFTFALAGAPWSRGRKQGSGSEVAGSNPVGDEILSAATFTFLHTTYLMNQLLVVMNLTVVRNKSVLNFYEPWRHFFIYISY